MFWSVPEVPPGSVPPFASPVDPDEVGGTVVVVDGESVVEVVVGERGSVVEVVVGDTVLRRLVGVARVVVVVVGGIVVVVTGGSVVVVVVVVVVEVAIGVNGATAAATTVSGMPTPQVDTDAALFESPVYDAYHQ